MTQEKPECKLCGAQLKFRSWSKRYARLKRYREALAECPNGCGKWALRYFDGVATCEPYQVRRRGTKNRSGSYRISDTRFGEIVARWGSVQAFLDLAPVSAV